MVTSDDNTSNESQLRTLNPVVGHQVTLYDLQHNVLDTHTCALFDTGYRYVDSHMHLHSAFAYATVLPIRYSVTE
jgi:hypothetical protein